MTPTRPAPPWTQPGYATQTFLEKSIGRKRVFVTPQDTRIFNIEYAREYVYQIPSVVWKT